MPCELVKKSLYMDNIINAYDKLEYIDYIVENDKCINDDSVLKYMLKIKKMCVNNTDINVINDALSYYC